MANPKLSIILSAKDEMSTNIEKAKRALENIKNSGASARQQLRALQQNLSELNSVGIHSGEVFTSTAEYAGQLADAISDARRAVNAFADDEFKLKAVGEALSLGTAAGSTLATTLDLLGVKNDEVTLAIKKTQMAITALNGVQQISNLLNKDSALRLRLKQIQLKINAATTTSNTTATTANTVATGANTVATRLATAAKQKLNIAMAIGKAIAGDWTGILALAGAGLLSYSLFAKEATDKTEEQTNALKKNTSALQDYNAKVGSEIGKVVSKFKSLQSQYVALRSESEKIKFINDNKEAFKQLGIAINNVTDAQKAFVENSDKVVAALVKQAKARAMTAVIEDKWKEFYEDSRNTHHFAGNVKSRSSLQDEEDKKALDDYMKIYGTDKQKKQYKKDGLIPDYMQYGAMKYLNRRRDEDKQSQSSKLEKETENLARAAASLENAAASDMKSAGLDLSGSSSPSSPKVSGSKTDKISPEAEKTSIDYAAQKVADLRKLWRAAPEDAKDAIKAELDIWENELKRRENGRSHELSVGLSIDTDITSVLDDLPDEIESPLKQIEEDSLTAYDAVAQLGSAFSGLGNAIGGAGGQWVSFIGTAMDSIAKLIPEIAALITAKEGEAMAGAAASGAGIGFPQNLAAIAAGVAAVASIFAAIPKFESGGIVGGSSFYGDRTLVRANAGEMILNRQQQNNLYRAIADNNLGGGMRGNVVFTIKGDTLVGALNNYNYKTRRQG